jgi:hypothetical protein
VQVWYNQNGKFSYGDRAKVYVRTAQDGNLIVFRSDARGNIRVLFPLDPDDDQRVPGNKKLEIRGRGGREAFVVEDTSAHGVVLAAWSKNPFDLRRFDRNGHWDLQALDQASGDASGDPEARLLALADQLKPEGSHYEYDAPTYMVSSRRYADRGYYPGPYGWAAGLWGDPWWGWPYYGGRFVFVPRRIGFVRRR